MVDDSHLELGEFSSSEQPSTPIYRRTSHVAYAHSSRPNGRKHGTKEQGMPRSTAMLIKIGICAAICALFAFLKLIDNPKVNTALDSIGSAFDTEQDEDTTLGKLKFVDLPGILEVFAGGDRLIRPIEFQSASLDDSETYLSLVGERNALVTVCDEGKVKTVGRDDRLGGYVTIVHDNTETQYYGLDTITVDEGQPVKKLDTLGRLRNDGVLVLRITQNGAPVNPCEHIGIDIADYMG